MLQCQAALRAQACMHERLRQCIVHRSTCLSSAPSVTGPLCMRQRSVPKSLTAGACARRPHWGLLPQLKVSPHCERRLQLQKRRVFCVIAMPPQVLVRLDFGFDHCQIEVLHHLGLLVESVRKLWHSRPFSELGVKLDGVLTSQTFSASTSQYGRYSAQWLS